MAISYDLISEFAKITNDKKKENKETNTYGRIVMYGNVPYVKLDGSEIITPCTTMIAVEDGDRVAVQIKNHNAFITGGITNPAASTKQMSGVKEDVAKFNTVVTDKLVVSDIEAINGYFQQLTVVAGRYDDLTAATAKIDELKGRYASFDRISADDIKSMNAEIDNLKTMMINAEGISAKDLETVNAQIGNLTAYNASFGYLSAEDLRAIKANIKHLDVNVFDAETGNIKFAKIDFSNIKMAAIEHLLSESGIIKDITSETGKITGELVGVTIKGDLIEGNTVTADKLVILGEDGAYYKLNIDGLNNISTSQAGKFEAVQNEPDNWETNYKDYYEIVNNEYVHLTDEEVPEWSSNKYYKLTAVHGQGLDGTNIIAQTITADKITVSDLVAFGATIGGFHITDHSIYSGVKSSATNTTRGVFMNDNGEFAVGDSSNFLRYYYDETDKVYKLEISAAVIEMGGTGKTLEETISEIKTTADNADSKANNVTGDLQGYKQTNNYNYGQAMKRIDSINKLISSLAIDESGTGTYMDQTTGTFTFTLGDIVNSLQEKINSETYASDKSETQEQIGNIMGRAGNLELKTAQIQISKDNTGSPVMLFGSTDSKFKVRITNKSIDFMYDAIILACANHETFNSDIMAVNRELQNILSSTTTYNSSSNGTTPPTDGWQNEIPEEIQSGNYLWIKTVKSGFVWKTRKNGNMSLTPFESESNIAEEIKNNEE